VLRCSNAGRWSCGCVLLCGAFALSSDEEPAPRRRAVGQKYLKAKDRATTAGVRSLLLDWDIGCRTKNWHYWYGVLFCLDSPFLLTAHVCAYQVRRLLRQSHWPRSRRGPGGSEAISPAITPMSRVATIACHARRHSSNPTQVAGMRRKGLLRIGRQMLARSPTLRSWKIHSMRTSFPISFTSFFASTTFYLPHKKNRTPKFVRVRAVAFCGGRFVTICFIPTQ